MRRKLELEIDYNNICNLDCDYCILKRRETISESKVNIDDIINFAVKYIKNNSYTTVCIRVTSCEPLLVIDDIIKLASVLNIIGVQTEIKVITNATIVDKEKLLSLKKLASRIYLTISIDELLTNQRHRKYKNQEYLKTNIVLNNAKEIEKFLDTKAIYSSVITQHSYEEINKQINYFKEIGRINLLQFDINNRNRDEEAEKIVKENAENSCSLDCLKNINMICIDFLGNIYMCRAQKTAGIEPSSNIFEYTNGLIDHNLSNIFNLLKLKYNELNVCPFTKFIQGEMINE